MMIYACNFSYIIMYNYYNNNIYVDTCLLGRHCNYGFHTMEHSDTYGGEKYKEHMKEGGFLTYLILHEY